MSGAILGVLASLGGLPTVDLTLSATTTNYNLFTAAGSPSVPTKVNLTINSGVTVGGTSGNTALTVGQFPSGSIITITNNGNIDGFGGSAGTSGVGGNGGDAIKADYANQQVIINNNVGANIRGGGGGGGKGGTGGTGGAGTYTDVNGYVYVNYFPGSCDAICTANGYQYCGGECSLGAGFSVCYGCVRTAYSSGGAGGAGGNGGVGQGYNQSSTTGATGANGSAGGTNAGAGGKGGTGGNGAAFGAGGAAGATGSTGANGNYGSGSGGSAGSSGGTAGRYLVKGSADVTMNNSGTLAGGLA